MMDAVVKERDGVNWGQVGAFVGLTFGLTWLLDLVLWRTAGYASEIAGMALQLQMLLPAFSAMLLGLAVFKDSPLRLGRLKGASRLFVFWFLFYTLAYVASTAASILVPQLFPTLSIVTLALTLLGLLLVIVIRFVHGRSALSGAGVIGAGPRWWLLFGVGFVLFYMSQTALNYLFGLGHPADLSQLAQQAMMPTEILLLVSGIQSVLVGPFMGLLIAFGEEYGWRGYLQSELVRMGRVRGILLVGIIWGVWHAPVIMMGHNYPGYPIAGVFLMTVYTVLLGFVLGYAVLKTGSVWLAAFLHALNNQVYSYLSGIVYTPNDPVFGFGGGIYGLVVLAVVVLLVLRDPIWRQAGQEPAAAGSAA